MKKVRRKGMSFLLALVLFINAFSIRVLADSDPYVLTQNTVQNTSGQWVTSGGCYNSDWERYNCYAYAINRCENPAFYRKRTSDGIQYEVGDICGMKPLVFSLDKIVPIVIEELELMGYTNVMDYDYIPTVTASDKLICVRISKNQDNYHFMRYDYATDAWYHKPSSTAVLKFNGIPSNDVDWTGEYVVSTGAYGDGVIYSGSIKYIKYSNNEINLPQSTPLSKRIKAGNDIFYEIKVSELDNYDLTMTSTYAFNYELYDENFNIKSSNEAKTSISTVLVNLNPGIYYLRVNFYNDTIEGNVSINIRHQSHTYPTRASYHNNSLHKRTCACGEYILESHYVRRADIVDGRYANCVGCLRRLDLSTDNAGIIMSNIVKVTDNGSYILSNGVVVLVDEDIDAYLDGSLEFYNPNNEATKR